MLVRLHAPRGSRAGEHALFFDRLAGSRGSTAKRPVASHPEATRPGFGVLWAHGAAVQVMLGVAYPGTPKPRWASQPDTDKTDPTSPLQFGKDAA